MKEYNMKQYGGEKTVDKIIEESEMNIYMDGEFMTRLSCLSEEAEELVRGYLYGCKITDFKIVGDDAQVKTAGRSVAGKLAAIQFNGEHILKCAKEMEKASKLFAETGAVHSAGLYNGGGRIYFCEDIGRHNAVDKVLGHAEMDELRLEDCFMITSCRIPEDMVVTIINAGIPVLISRSAVTDKAIDIAIENDLTLVGFARNGCMNIYSGHERIK